MAHSHRSNFNDLGARDVLIGGLDVYRGKVVEGVAEGARANELRGLEQTKGETELGQIVWDNPLRIWFRHAAECNAAHPHLQ